MRALMWQVGYHIRLRQSISCLRSASAATVATEGLAESLRDRCRCPVHVVTNGFDPEDFSTGLTNRSEQKRQLFEILYAGSFTTGQNPTRFLQGIDLLLSRRPSLRRDMKVTFYGSSSKEVPTLKKLLQWQEVLHAGGYLPHRQITECMQNADVLYLATYPVKGIATGKIYEYLAAGRPILSVVGDGDTTDRMLAETEAGVVAQTPEQVAGVLGAWYDEWQENGSVKIRQNHERIQLYSRRRQAEHLAAVLDEVAG